MAFIQTSESTTQEKVIGVDPRTKILLLFFVSILSISINDFFFLLTLLDLIIVITILSDVDLEKIIRFIKPTFWLILPIFVIQLFFSYDKTGPLVVLPENWGNALGGYTLISTGSIFYAGSITFRILILALSSTLFSLSTDTNDFLIALRKIGVPYDLAIVVGLIIYFLPMVVTETSAVNSALETRGVSIRKGGFVKRIRTFRILITTILMNFIEKSKFQTISMETRGFSSNQKKSSLKKMKLHFFDYLIMILAIGIFSGIVYYYRIEIITPWLEMDLIEFLIELFQK